MATTKTAKGRATNSKTAKAANEKAKDTATLRRLDGKAKVINVRFEKAAQMEGKADDHRLAAAIELANVKETCTGSKINFKKWVEEHIHGDGTSWENVRKLATVGGEADPRQALEDLRKGNADRNKKLRAKKKTVSRDTSAPAPVKQIETKIPAFQRAESVIADLTSKERQAIVDTTAAIDNKTVVSKDELAKLRDVSNSTVSLASMQKFFGELKASDKMRFVQWAAQQIGFEAVDPFDKDTGKKSDDSGDEMPEMPKALRAKSTKTRPRRKAAAAAA